MMRLMTLMIIGLAGNRFSIFIKTISDNGA